MHTKHFYNRRDFFKRIGLVSAAGLLYTSCRQANPLAHIKGGIINSNNRGHLLRDNTALPRPTKTFDKDVVIVGGGITALSAKRWLERKGVKDIMLLEMEDHFGGNATYGKNEVSAYPWAAHYIPVPDLRNTELLDFLKEINVVTNYSADGLPVYNDYYMCHDPEERIFINGAWQEGIIPMFGVPAWEKEQMKKFSDLVARLKNETGSDGKDAFTIPLEKSSADPKYRDLDAIPFSDYLAQAGYNAPHLIWYLEYCCKDDYGSSLQNTSAWAGLHYFCSRKGKGANANANTVLTWPEGNGFLMEHLRRQVSAKGMRANCMARKVDIENGTGKVLVQDFATSEVYWVKARKLLMATPQFVNKHLIDFDHDRLQHYSSFQYAPWVIANLTVNRMPQGNGMALCWDNVIYGTKSVGYVDANHQDLKDDKRRVITFYLPLSDREPAPARQWAQDKDYHFWLRMIVDELEYCHPGITTHIERADIRIRGHGMIAPRPGFVWGEARRQAAEPIANTLFFAHTDLSGISIFEEAFYQGIRAAEQMLGG